jgi:excisionase family DNA binding protein
VKEPELPRTTPAPPRDWKSTRESAEYAGVCVKTIRRRIADGSLPAHRLGPKLFRIDRADLDRLFRRVPTVSNGT